MVISINSFFGRIAALSVSEHIVFGGARNPHAHKCVPVSSAPCALHFIPKNEFLEVPIGSLRNLSEWFCAQC